MIITLAVIGISALNQATPVQCPIMTGAANLKAASTNYKGVNYAYCCAGCEGTFTRDPEKALKAVKGRTVGTSLFDPVSKARIESKDAVGSSDFGGVRYLFATKENKAAFDKAPKSFSVAPAKEVVWCPVMDHAIDGGMDKAGAYADVNGVRYYFCCTGCQGKFAADSSKYIGKVSSRISAAKPVRVAPK